jgi:hypothetical protein
VLVLLGSRVGWAVFTRTDNHNICLPVCRHLVSTLVLCAIDGEEETEGYEDIEDNICVRKLTRCYRTSRVGGWSRGPELCGYPKLILSEV